MPFKTFSVLLAGFLGCLAAPSAFAQQCPVSVPVQGAVPPGPLPVFPIDNWWNVDVQSAPVDPGSSAYIAFINNGGTRRLHPDFGGEESPGSVATYGMPYAIVDGTQPKQSVTFDYWDESDGVNYSTGQGVPFYPIPAQAITGSHWIEGGAAGNVDQRSQSDRHLLMIDCTDKYLYELYNVYYNPTQARWYAGSGAFFDMNTNNRRPDTWTSADAAGLAIFPGLVRYDEAADPAVTEIDHAFRVTVRSTNGYVFPASHRAGSTSGALPMGARLRLKTNVAGQDPALRTSDPAARKIFRAMQQHGLIVADNGSDMFITGTFDVRWNNDVLNPAFSTLTASDFEVIQLGWNSPPPATPLPSALSVSPNPVFGGTDSAGTVTFTAPAPAGGALVALSSNNAAATVPASVNVAQGAVSATFGISTSVVSATTTPTLSASYGGVTKSATLTVKPLPQTALASLTLSPTSVSGGGSVTGTVTLTIAAPSGGVAVTLKSANTNLATVPVSVLVPAGSKSKTFAIATKTTKKNASVVISATYAGVTKTASLSVKR